MELVYIRILYEKIIHNRNVYYLIKKESVKWLKIQDIKNSKKKIKNCTIVLFKTICYKYIVIIFY